MNQTIKKSDKTGILASFLCFVHCLAAPFFIGLTSSVSQHTDSHDGEFTWWAQLDFLFLLISAYAIYKTCQTIRMSWIKIGFWMLWAVLSFVIINERVHLLEIPESAIYFPTFSLIGLHIYNSLYSPCEKECSTT